MYKNDWVEPKVSEYADVIYPATGEVIARTPLSCIAEVDDAARAAACIFRKEVDAGNNRINIGVAALMAFFTLIGWKNSFFDDMQGQGMDEVEFLTQKKLFIERWPKEWSHKF